MRIFDPFGRLLMTPLGLRTDQTNGLHMPLKSASSFHSPCFLPESFLYLPPFLPGAIFNSLTHYLSMQITKWRCEDLKYSIPQKNPLFFSLYLWGQLAFVSERKLWYLMFFLKADCKSFVIRKPYEVHDFLLVLLFTQFPIRLITDKLCHMTQQINPYCCSRKFVLKILL